MKFFQITWFHFKRIVFQNFSLIIMSFVLPLFTTCGLIFLISSSSNPSLGQAIAVVNHSEYVQENIYPKLSESYQNYFTEESRSSFERLDQADISMIYEIPSTSPQEGTIIKVHSINGENNDISFETAFQAASSEALLESAFEDVNTRFVPINVKEPSLIQQFTPIDSRLVMSIFMVTFFMSYACGIIAGDLNKLRGDGVLTRSIISNARSWHILGSVLSAYVIYHFISSLLIIAIVSIIFSIPISQLSLILSTLFAYCIFTMGLTMILFRLLKNEQIIQFIAIVIIIFLVFMGLNIFNFEKISFIQYFSPFYWLFQALDTGFVFPNIPVIALFGIVLFTAGSFKVERLVRI